MDSSMKDDPDIAAQLALVAGVTNLPMAWSQAAPVPISAPVAHQSTLAQQMPVTPPPAHAHTHLSTNQKPPDSFIDKGLLEAAALLEGKGPMILPLKPGDTATATSGAPNDTNLPWAIQNTLLQQYGQFMLDRMLNKQEEGGTTQVATATTDAVQANHNPGSVAVTTSPTNQKGDPDTEIETQRDVYRRMLNYSMSSALTQQYYLSQYGYNYIQDKSLFTKPESGQSTSTTTSVGGEQISSSRQGGLSVAGSQLPSIDSVLLNLSTKKTSPTGTHPPPGGITSQHQPQTQAHHQTPAHHQTHVSSIPAYGLQALANAAIEADPKAFHDADTDRKDGQKSELDDITDTDDSNMSPSDSSTSQIMSPPRNSYSHMMENTHISIPAAHSHSHQYQGGMYQPKTVAANPLPGIQHFSAMSKAPTKPVDVIQNIQHHHLSQGGAMRPSDLATVTGGIKPSDLVAAAMRLKVEPSEEKEIADRTIQEQIAAHQLNAVQQQVHDLTAGALNLDAAALLAKLPLGAHLDVELQRQMMERVYDHYDPDTLQALQQEPMELTSDVSPGKTNSRRKSRGRPTSIESLRDPLGRQSSTSSLGGNTSFSGDGEDRTYDCEICGKQFSHNDRLRRHRKIHTTEKPYKCDICGKGFKEKCNLKHHRFIHTGEKPYKCDTCGKSFNQRSSLKTHQKVHTGEKPFRCELCEKPFAQKYLLRQHMKKHIEISMPQQQGGGVSGVGVGLGGVGAGLSGVGAGLDHLHQQGHQQ